MKAFGNICVLVYEQFHWFFQRETDELLNLITENNIRHNIIILVGQQRRIYRYVKQLRRRGKQ